MKSPARPACLRIANSLIDRFARAIVTLTTFLHPRARINVTSAILCTTGSAQILTFYSVRAHTIEGTLFYLSLHIRLMYAADGKMSAERGAIFHHSESVKGKAEIAFFE